MCYELGGSSGVLSLLNRSSAIHFSGYFQRWFIYHLQQADCLDDSPALTADATHYVFFFVNYGKWSFKPVMVICGSWCKTHFVFLPVHYRKWSSKSMMALQRRASLFTIIDKRLPYTVFYNMLSEAFLYMFWKGEQFFNFPVFQLSQNLLSLNHCCPNWCYLMGEDFRYSSIRYFLRLVTAKDLSDLEWFRAANMILEVSEMVFPCMFDDSVYVRWLRWRRAIDVYKTIVKICFAT